MDNLHVVVSGGARGLGLSFCEGLLSQGYLVTTFSRRGTTKMLELALQYPESFFYDECDITNSESLARLVGDAENRFGPIYGLVNNSAIAVDGVLATLPEIEVSKMISVNLESAICFARLCLRKMLSRKDGGRIINISSIVGFRGFTGLSVYSATKAGLDGFTRSLAREVGRRGITVNSIAPGYMTSDMSAGLSDQRLRQIVNRTPMGRLASFEDVTPLLLFLMSKGGQFITGQTIVVDGGGSV